MSKYPIYTLAFGELEQIAGASSIESALEIIQELQEEGYESLVVGIPDKADANE